MKKIIVLFSTYNRPKITAQAIEFFNLRFRQLANIDVTLCIVDSSTNNDTFNLVQSCANIKVLFYKVSELYWAQSMSYGYEKIKNEDFDFLLCINDDVFFYDYFLDNFDYPQNKVIVGNTVDEFGNQSYGLRTLRYHWLPFSPRFLHECRQSRLTFNMNCLLVPRAILDEFGFLTEGYIHSIADYDYGLKLFDAGVKIESFPYFVGLCNRNAAVFENRLRFSETFMRVQVALSDKYFPRKAWWLYLERNFRRYRFLYFLVPYVKAALGRL